jgi:hypothetical protein
MRPVPLAVDASLRQNVQHDARLDGRRAVLLFPHIEAFRSGPGMPLRDWPDAVTHIAARFRCSPPDFRESEGSPGWRR